MSKFSAINPGAAATSTANVSIGTRHEDAFGRVFYYAYCATAIGRGKVGIAAATIANHNNLSWAVAPAIGDKTVKVTLGGTALTADQYKDGWLTVNDGTGEGRTFRIEGNDAQTSTTGTGVIYLAEAMDMAGALSETNVDLEYNLFDNVRVHPDTTQTYVPAGVPIMSGGLGSSKYGYIQTWGDCAVWRDEADAGLGDPFTFGAGTGTGQIENTDAATELTFGRFGPAAGVDTEYQRVFLQIMR